MKLTLNQFLKIIKYNLREVIYNQEIFYSLSKVFCLILIVVIPFYFLPNTTSFTYVNKIFLSSIILLLAFIFYLNHILIRKEVKLPDKIILGSLITFLIIAFLSTFLSKAKYYSFWGLLSSSHSFLSYILYFLTFILCFWIFKKEDYKVLLFLLTIIFLFANILAISSIFQKPLFQTGIYFIGSLSDIVIFEGLGLLLAILILLNKSYIKELFENKVLYYILFLASSLNSIMSFFVLIILNFTNIWLILTISIFLLIFYKHFKYTPLDTESIFLIFFFLIFLLTFIFSPYINLAINNIYRFPPFAESKPNLNLNLHITFSSLKESFKNLFIGNGPNLFLYSWLKYKPIFLSQILARFDQGFNFLLTLLTELGVLGFSIFLFIIFYFILILFNRLDESTSRMFYILSVFLIISLFYHPLGIVNGLYLFFLMGLTITFNEGKVIYLNFHNKNLKKILLIVLYVALIIVSVYSLYLISLKYLANVFYAKGVLQTQNNNLDLAINNIRVAAFLDPTSDLYYRDLSFLMMQNLIKNASVVATTTPQFQQFILTSLSTTINYASYALSLNPIEPLNYSNLAYIYQNIGVTNPQILSHVEANYKEAMKLDPTNHTYYLNLGLVYLSVDKKDLARNLLQTAYNLSLDSSILDIIKNLENK